MSLTPRVSVVIPAHNEAAVIGQCLDALRLQTTPPFEIILVDNNCTDATISTARAAKLPMLRIVHAAQQGIGPARTAGFDAAKGTIIARIDADTSVVPGWIAEITTFFTNHPTVAAITGPGEFRDFPKIVRPAITTLHTRLYYHSTAKMLGHETLWGSNMAITRPMWQRVRHSVIDDDNLVHEDVDLAIHVHRAGGAIVFDPQLKAAVLMRQLYRSPRNTYYYFKRRKSTITANQMD